MVTFRAVTMERKLSISARAVELSRPEVGYE